MNVLVLLSGGVDSSCCIDFYRRMNCAVSAVFVDYGQPVAREEGVSAAAIARYYSIPLHVIRCAGPSTEFHGEIPGRNAFLAFAAILFTPAHVGLVALGIHAGTRFFDCSESFAGALDRLLSAYSNGRIALGAPFLRFTKRMIFEFCIDNDVPVQLTWSCEVGPGTPCGRCLSCKDREGFDAR